MSSAAAPRMPAAVRRAQPGDVDAMLRIEQAAFATDRLSRRSLARLVRSLSTHMLVAVTDDAVFGYAAVLTRRGTRTARLYSLAVDPARRGRGVGEALLRAALACARGEGADRLRLEVRVDNRAAEQLYRRAGFVTVESLPRYYQDGGDGLRMEKCLVDAAA